MMDDGQEGFADEFSQEIEDLIDATVEDEDPERAVHLMEAALRQGLPAAQLPTAYLVLGMRYEDLDQLDRAIDCYSRAIRLHSEDPVVYFWRGELLFQQGHFPEARADLETALALTEARSSSYEPDRQQARELLRQIEGSG